MTKFWYGTIELNDAVIGNSATTAHVVDGKLVSATRSDLPRHDISEIELPDGATPMGVIPALTDSESDILVWCKPKE